MSVGRGTVRDADRERTDGGVHGPPPEAQGQGEHVPDSYVTRGWKRGLGCLRLSRTWLHADRRARGRGCSLTVQPAASAGATLRVIIDMGKFHGVMAPTTPTGCRSVKKRRPPDT